MSENSANPDDVTVVFNAIKTVLKAEGFDSYVADAKVQAWADYVVLCLEARQRTKP